jgi:outer membrane protein TolC
MSHAIRTTFVVLFAVVAGLTSAAAQPTPADSAPSLEWRARLAEAIRRAAAHDPRLHAAEARAEAARHRVARAATLPDPEVEVGLKDVPVRDLSLARDNFTMEMVTGRQRFPGRGKRAAERAAAQAEAEGLGAERARERIAVAADTAGAFFQLAEADRSLALLAMARQRLEDAAASVTERYRVGMASQSDVLQASLEKTSLDERLSTLGAERRARAARFNTLQGLPAAAPVASLGTVEPDGEGLPSLPPIPSVEELVRQAIARSPGVAGAVAAVRQAEEEVTLAVLEGRPDWTVLAYYGRRERFDDFIGLSAAINLPWAHRQRLVERRAEKEAERTAAQARVEAERDQIQEAVEAAYAELEKNREQARLYRDSILPQAEIHYRSAREAYVVGKIDFLTLARAAADLDLYAREAAARATGIGRAIAALEKASGLPLLETIADSGGSHVEN